MRRTNLLRQFKPRVLDYQTCDEWPAEAKSLLAPRPTPPATMVTVKLEGLSPAAGRQLARLVEAAGGQAWPAAPNGLLVRSQLDAALALSDRRADLPPDALQPALAMRDALECCQVRGFRLKLDSGPLRLAQRTAVMGVLNITPDSFSDGGAFFAKEQAIDHALAMCEAGADIIDIGGESTRPGAAPVSEAEERRRVLPVIEALASRIAQPISIDTCKAAVARQALAAGAQILNDVSALGADAAMADVAAESGAPVVLMHMRGSPRTMQRRPRYRDVISEIAGYLRERIDFAVAAGVDERQIVVDPGIGFGKTVRHNLEIMRRLREFRSLGRPVLVGTSRKSFIGKVLDAPAGEREWGTAATVAWAAAHGAAIVRVHDVASAVDVVGMTQSMLSQPR